MRFWNVVIMTGIGFTIGLLCGLLVHLPAETLPVEAFESHHLNRVRRVAQVEPQGTDYGHLDLNYVDNSGSAGKQNVKSNSMNVDYIALEQLNRNQKDNQGYEAISGERTGQYNVLSKYPSTGHESVVYVNPTQQKLVLDSTVNNANDSNLASRPHVSDIRVGNADMTDNKINSKHHNNDEHNRSGGHVTGTNHVITGKTGALGHRDGIAKQIENDNYRQDTASAEDAVIIDGVFWGDKVEQSCPKGFTTADEANWRTKATNEKFLTMNEGCGRMQNRVLTFQSTDKACARYRLNVDQIQGEIYSYYLSKLLGISNVPPSTLHIADSNQDQWRMVGQDVATARWSQERPLILSQWLDDLTPAYIPEEFRNLSKVLSVREVTENLRKVDNKLNNGASGSSLCELLQWSDLIVFDYLTANLDRVVNNLFNLQWNDKMMSKPAHNLEKSSNGRLIFLDNESGLFHGYRLLDKYAPYHESLLKSVCLFRKDTIGAIRKFVATDSIGDSLHAIFEQNEVLHRNIPRIPTKNIKILKSRMEAVLRQVQMCEYRV